jgi:hypothetical protein
VTSSTAIDLGLIELPPEAAAELAPEVTVPELLLLLLLLLLPHAATPTPTSAVTTAARTGLLLLLKCI